MELLQNISIILANVAVIAATVIGVLQFIRFTRATKADHERRKKQATIEFYNEIDKEAFLLESMMIEKGIIGHVPIATINEDVNFKEAVLRYMNLFERFSVGINTGVYDIYVFDRMMGRKVIYRFNSLRAYIEQRRSELNYQYLYNDFEKMIEYLKEVRKERFHTENAEKDVAKIEYDVLKK